MTVVLAHLPRLLLSILIVCLSQAVTALRGDSWCGILMCVNATVNADGSVVTYTMKSLNQLGWMAIGFGSQMAGTPMVIMWRNADGSVSLSQRQATGLVEPIPVASPPRRATVYITDANPASAVDSPILAFNIPSESEDEEKELVRIRDVSNSTPGPQTLIWAFGVTVPSSADPASHIEQHQDAGTFTLDLSKTLNDGGDSPSTESSAPAPTDAESETRRDPASSPTPNATRTSNGSASNNLVQPASSTATSGSPAPSGRQPPSQSSPPPSAAETVAESGAHGLLVAHAVFSAAGFVMLLPLSALVARWARTLTPRWLSAHWVLSVLLGIPAVCVGWALGPLVVAQEGMAHFVSVHQICGVILLLLYIVEVALGTIVHVRRKDGAPSAHPPRNVGHVFLGLAMFGLAIFQVRMSSSSRSTCRPPLI
ncbi:hypothetical protein C8Q73DRAFT_232853 [Cubamyces lactineus]|nr:hypothetical protein C8Q73DRAFT_232853 [Cubamyces lactineus]